MNREEFKAYALKQVPTYASCGLLDDGEPFWIPEFAENRKCNVFVETKQIKVRYEFRQWNKRHLSCAPLCFVSDSEKDREWWGLDNQQDATLFALRWS